MRASTPAQQNSLPSPTTTPFLAFLHPGTVLEPDTLSQWLAATNDDTIAVYSDWDHLDSQGRRHTPRFTPCSSPELLSQTPYWGPAFLVRTSAIPPNWPENAAPSSLLHDLARQLTASGGPIVRVPGILSHLPGSPNPSPATLPIKPVATAERASIIICSRRPQLLKRCLASLRPAIKQGHEVIAVLHEIDGPTGLKAVADRYGARSVPYHGAFHFGMMNQLGVSAASHSTLLFLNDDVRPKSPDWLDRLLAQAARPDVGITGALLLYPSGAIQHAGVVVGQREVPAHIGRFETESAYWPWLRMTREVSAVTGACFAMRRGVWDELAGFDLRFPVNFNDVDLCLRAARRGYRIIIETGAVLIHAESQTRRPVVSQYERDLFWDIWSDLRDTVDPFFNPNLDISDEAIALRSPWANSPRAHP